MRGRISGLMLAAAFGACSANAEGLTWSQDRDSIIRVDSSDAGTATDFYSFSSTIRTSGGDGPVLILNCQAMSTGRHSLNAAIQLDPANAYEENPSEHLRLLSVSVALSVDGKKSSERFKYHPASSKIVPYDKAIAKRLFNAAVTGADVTLKVKGETHDLALPDKDQVFVRFAKTCPTTNGGTFDPSIFEAAATLENAEK